MSKMGCLFSVNGRCSTPALPMGCTYFFTLFSWSKGLTLNNLTRIVCFSGFLGRTSEVIDKFISLDTNSKIVFTGYKSLE